jgi:hypothetical protein
MQGGPGGFGPGPDDDAAAVAVRIIAVGGFTGPASRHRAK